MTKILIHNIKKENILTITQNKFTLCMTKASHLKARPFSHVQSTAFQLTNSQLKVKLVVNPCHVDSITITAHFSITLMLFT